MENNASFFRMRPLSWSLLLLLLLLIGVVVEQSPEDIDHLFARRDTDGRAEVHRTHLPRAAVPVPRPQRPVHPDGE